MALGVDQNCEISQSTELKKPTVKRTEGKTMGSRRIFSVKFKLQVLDSFHKDSDCQGNQRATARKYGIHRRQVQKWLQMENNLRSTAQASVICDAARGGYGNGKPASLALNLCASRQRVASARPDTKESTSSPASSPSLGCSGPASTASAASSTTSYSSLSDSEEGYINVDGISDDEDLDDSCSSVSSTSTLDKALDFTCAALSKRKFYSVDFKIQVLNSFHNDESCQKNQRATARKFGVHHRQIQKWLNKEQLLRNEFSLCQLDKSKSRASLANNFSSRVKFSALRLPVNECLDLSSNKRSLKSDSSDEPACKRKPLTSCCQPECNNNIVSSNLEDKALCLIKSEPQTQACSASPEITSTADFYCPLVYPSNEQSVPLRSSFSVLSPSEYPTYDPHSWPFYVPPTMRVHPEKPLPRRPSPLDIKTGNISWFQEFPTYLPSFFPKIDLQSSPHFKYAEFKQINADSFKFFTASATSYSSLFS